MNIDFDTLSHHVKSRLILLCKLSFCSCYKTIKARIFTANDKEANFILTKVFNNGI